MKTVLVVGSNRGLGLEVTKYLVQHKMYRVIATCRRTSDELTALKPFQIIEGVELNSDDCGDKIVQAIPRGTTIDYLYAVAGYFTTDTLDKLNLNETRKMYQICAIAPLIITSSLVQSELLSAGATVGLITSEGGSIGLRTEREGGDNYGHHMSKAAENMMGKILSLDAKPKGIAVVMVHPGFLRTEMTAHYAQFYEEFGAITADKAAGPIVDAVEQATLETTGRFIAPMGSNGLGLGVHALPNGKLEPFGQLPW